MIALILLAAGLSSRFGSPKSLATIDGETTIERLQKIILESPVDKTIVVLGSHSQSIQPHLFKHTKITSVYNKDYKFGQTSSVQTGVRVLENDAQAFLILPVDYPLVHSQTLKLIINESKKHPKKILLPTFQNRRGHPPLFDTSFKEQILNLKVNQGLNSILHQNTDLIHEVAVNDPGVLKTFNTPQELKKITG